MEILEAKDVGGPIWRPSAPVLCCFIGEEPKLIHPRRHGADYIVRWATNNFGCVLTPSVACPLTLVAHCVFLPEIVELYQ